MIISPGQKYKNMAETFAADQFSLRWNNFTNNLTSGFMTHLSDKDLVDVTLAVDGRLMQAHKLILSICSPYFKDIFMCNPCQHPVIILKDIGYTEVEALLRFMYQGEVNVRQEELANFLKVAETLQIKGLTGEESSNQEEFIKEESDTSARDETQKFAQHSDINELCIPSLKNYVNSNPPVHKRRNREPVAQGTKKSLKKRRTSVPALKDLDVPIASPKNAVVNAELPEPCENDRIEFFSKRNSNEFDDGLLTDDSIDLTKEDRTDENNEEFIAENMSFDHGFLTDDTSAPAVEPVTYRLSARGRPQLVHEGYVYNLTSRSEVLNRSHYRCAEQHRGCRGKCAVIAERFMPTGVNEHNHPPGYQSEHDYRKKKGMEPDQN